MAKVHLEAGRFGKAACGKEHVDTTTDVAVVTCEACERTEAFTATPAMHTHDWVQLWEDGPSVVDPSGILVTVSVPAGAKCDCGETLTQAQFAARSPS